MINFNNCSIVDHTRVRLKDVDPNIPGSDYINANYIKVNLFNILIEYLYINIKTYLYILFIE